MFICSNNNSSTNNQYLLSNDNVLNKQCPWFFTNRMFNLVLIVTLRKVFLSDFIDKETEPQRNWANHLSLITHVESTNNNPRLSELKWSLLYPSILFKVKKESKNLKKKDSSYLTKIVLWKKMNVPIDQKRKYRKQKTVSNN